MADEALTLKMRTRGARAAARDVDRTGRSVKGLDKQTRRLAKSQRIAAYTSTRLGGGMRLITRGAAAAGAGIAFLAGRELVKATKGWADHLAIVRRTNAVIRSTGGAARVTASHVDFLSQKIEKQTGIDNDIVQAGANMLLTFTNIRNGVGRNNKIFDEATSAITGMSQAGFDMRGSAIQVGKALNDPVKGITALTRVGVTFSKAQKEQIEDLVESGQRMKAQRIILRELRKEFPKVKATPWEKLQTALRNIEDSLGKAILPAVTRFVRRVTPAVEQFADDLGGVLDDKNLKWDEKLNRVGELLKRNFGPIIKSWDIPGHIGKAFGYAAPRALSAFWGAFKSMGTKGQLITAAVLLTRLGLTGPLLASAGRLMGARIGAAAAPAIGARMAPMFAAGGLGATALAGAGTAMGVALGLGIIAYLASDGFTKSLSGTLNSVAKFVNPGFQPPNTPKGYQPGLGQHAPYKRDSGPLRHAPSLSQANTQAYRGYQGIPPVIVQIDGKEVARATAKASTKKKSTR